MRIQKLLLFVTALASLSASAGFAPREQEPQTISANSDTAKTITLMERQWLDAIAAADVGKLELILADDWVDLSPDGTQLTKTEVLNSIKSGDSRMSSYQMGPVHVKVIGTVAVAQGSDVEKSSHKGKDTSGKYVWMDVFVKRDGKWQAVRSQEAMLR